MGFGSESFSHCFHFLLLPYFGIGSVLDWSSHFKLISSLLFSLPLSFCSTICEPSSTLSCHPSIVFIFKNFCCNVLISPTLSSSSPFFLPPSFLFCSLNVPFKIAFCSCFMIQFLLTFTNCFPPNFLSFCFFFALSLTAIPDFPSMSGDPWLCVPTVTMGVCQVRLLQWVVSWANSQGNP